MSRSSDEEVLVTKNLKGGGIDRPTYRMGTPRLHWRGRYVRLTPWIGPLVILIVVVIGAAMLFVRTSAWQSFAAGHPCILPGQGSFDYPGWLRALHWFNVLVMLILIKSGIQILADHPRLYRKINSLCDSEWLRFRGPVPRDRVWTALDDSTYLNSKVGLPGGRHTSGMARHWHYFAVAFWITIGVLFIVLLFATGQWRQIVPTTTEMVPSAITCGVTYASLHVPVGEEMAQSLNSLQLLTYFSVVFIAAPLAILTGIAQSPAVGHHYRFLQRAFGNRQIARSIHFLVWCFFCLFLVVHVILVVVTGLRRNLGHIVLDQPNETTWTGVIVGVVILLVIAAILWWANWMSWIHPRRIQHTFQRIAAHFNPILFGTVVPRMHWKESDIGEYMWTNGAPPKSAEFTKLREDGFRDYKLQVGGLVEQPKEFSLDDLRALGKHEQITEHDCVQGWSGVAKWGGVQISKVLEQVKPTPGARYAVFFGFPDDGKAENQFYDVHDLRQMYHPDSILAYEMNGAELPLRHGSPLRLRNESEFGFKQVKWLQRIEIRDHYDDLFQGEGGFREDNEFQSRSQEI